MTAATQAPAEDPLYLYALTHAAGPDLAPVAAVDGASPVALVRHGEIAAVVSRAPVEELAALAAEQHSAGPPDTDPAGSALLGVLALRHDAVVRAAFGRATVLPCRFGTVLTGPPAVLALLRSRHDEARDHLGRLDHHREWEVRLRAGQPEEPAAEQASARPAAARPSGAAYLLRRRDERAAAAARTRLVQSWAAAVEAELSPHASEHTPRVGGRADGVLSQVTYLVRDTAEDAFVAEFDRLEAQARADRLHLELTGPWPPYSFGALTPREVRGG